jgi:hypothetical protein
MHYFWSHGRDGSSSLLPRHAGRIGVVDTWAQSPLTVSGVLCSLGGKRVEVPSTPCTIPDMDFQWPLRFSLWYKWWGDEPLTLVFQSPTSWDRNHLSLPPILKLSPLHCLWCLVRETTTSILGAGALTVMATYHRPAEQGWTPLSIGHRHQSGGVLLCASVCLGLLLIVMPVPAYWWVQGSISFKCGGRVTPYFPERNKTS